MKTRSKTAPDTSRHLGRRTFLKLAAATGVVASLGGLGLSGPLPGTSNPRSADLSRARGAQYGRQRGRYPVAKRRSR